MPRCTFCKEVYEWPKGMTIVLNDGKVLSFCSSKCRKNFNLKRDSKKVNWVKRKKNEESTPSQPPHSANEKSAVKSEK